MGVLGYSCLQRQLARENVSSPLSVRSCEKQIVVSRYLEGASLLMVSLSGMERNY